MRRFWNQVTVTQSDASYPILLDGKPARLPGGAPLALAHRRLAEAIAAEWQATGPTVTAADLVLTSLAAAAIERIAPDPAPLRRNLLAYGGTDLLCYRATTPPALAAHQHAAWQPWLDWADRNFGAALHTTFGIAPITQDPAALDRLDRALAAQDIWTLSGLGVIVPALGSLVLGLATTSFALPAAAAHDLACLDQDWQERHWGTDAAATNQREAVGREIASAVEFVTLTRSCSPNH